MSLTRKKSDTINFDSNKSDFGASCYRKSVISVVTRKTFFIMVYVALPPQKDDNVRVEIN